VYIASSTSSSSELIHIPVINEYVPKTIEKMDMYNITREATFRHAGALATEPALTKEPAEDLLCPSTSSFKESHM
jgi:hypothetical protein